MIAQNAAMPSASSDSCCDVPPPRMPMPRMVISMARLASRPSTGTMTCFNRLPSARPWKAMMVHKQVSAYKTNVPKLEASVMPVKVTTETTPRMPTSAETTTMAHTAVWAMVVVSALVGILGVVSVVTLTGITLASNFGTFVLYALTCLWTIVAFQGKAEGSLLKHVIVPLLGLLANLAMLITILGMGFLGGGTSQQESLLALGIAALWAIVSAGYVFFNSRRSGRTMFATPGATPVAAERV